MKLPNLNALRAFEASGRHGSFRGASVELSVTQGAVAQQVRRLEADLGVKLFDRAPRGLTFTEAGATYHALVSKSFSEIEAATRLLMPSPQALRIGLPASLASRWLLRRLGVFRNVLPGRAITLKTSEKRCSVLTGEAELVISYGRDNLEDLPATLLAPDQIVAVAAPVIAARLHGVKRIEDLAGETLLGDNHGRWTEKLGEDTPVMNLGQSHLALESAEDGQGIALVSRLLASDALAIGKLKVLWTDPEVDEDQGYFMQVAPVENSALGKLHRHLLAQAQMA